MNTIESVIEFVGLCVFTTQLVNGNATTALLKSPATNLNTQTVVVGIMPRVLNDNRRIDPASRAKTSLKRPMASTEQPIVNDTSVVHDPHVAVETHTAMLVFHSGAVIGSVTGWTTHPLHPGGLDDWVYVPLSGDQIVFESDAPSPLVTPALDHLAIPHLGHSPTLRSPYTPPAYAGAAAVFRISRGKLGACEKGPSPEGSHARIDTTLTLNTATKLVITTVSHNKSITLQAGSRVLAGNITMDFATNQTVTANAHYHYMAYCAMTGQTQCVWPPSTSDTNTSTDEVVPCPADAAYMPSGGATETTSRARNALQSPPRGPDPFPHREADYACSNTQWP